MPPRLLTLGLMLLALGACADGPPAATPTGVVKPGADVAVTSTIVLHPFAYGNWISARAYGCDEGLGLWDCVNDQPGNATSGDAVADDGDATMLAINGKRSWTPKASFRLDEAQVPDGFTVSEMTVVARAASAKARGRIGAIRLFLRLDGAHGPDVPCPSGSTEVPETTYTTVTCTFSGLALNSLPEIGLEETGGGELKVTQMHAAVGY